MDDKKYCVYLITNMVNGKQYAGLTSQGLKTRWNCHRSKSDKGVLRSLYAGMRKHGADSFIPVVLRESLTRKEAGIEEKLVIRTLKLTDRSLGYNMTYGGEGGVPTKEIIDRICEGRGMKQDPMCGDNFYATALPTAKILEEYKEGLSTKAIAEKYGCSSQTIGKRIKDAGVHLRTHTENGIILASKDSWGFKTNPPNNTGSKRTEETKQRMRDNNKQRRRDVSDEEVVRLYQEGLSSPQIADKFSMTHPAIQRRLRLNGVQLRSPGVN